MNWRLSTGFLRQDGVIRGTTAERLSLGLNFQQLLFNDRLDIRAIQKGSRAVDGFTPGGVLSNAAQMGPTQPVTDPATSTGFYDWPGNKLTSPDNPIAILELATETEEMVARHAAHATGDAHARTGILAVKVGGTA